MKIIYTFHFREKYKELPSCIKIKAEEKENIFRINPFDARLKTHKLGGKQQDYWAFSIDHKYRIIFEFIKNNTVLFHAIGDHSIYK